MVLGCTLQQFIAMSMQILLAVTKEIDISETYLGWYAAIQKRSAVAAVLDFTDEEWESLMRLRDADAV